MLYILYSTIFRNLKCCTGQVTYRVVPIGSNDDGGSRSQGSRPYVVSQVRIDWHVLYYLLSIVMLC